MNKFMPFKNDSQVVTLGKDAEMTIENGKEKIYFYGNMELSLKDEKTVDLLLEILNSIKKEIELKKLSTDVKKVNF